MKKKLRCELISWSEIQRLCLKLAQQIKVSEFDPDVVVAIGRGGYVPARLLCDYLDIMALTSIKIELYHSGSKKSEQAVIKYPLCVNVKGQKILLVDDVNDSGETLDMALNHLHAFAPAEIRTAVLHQKLSTHCAIDYYAKKVIKWRWLIYPWAVHEDISSFLQAMKPQPASLQTAQQRLEDEYAVKISLTRLKEIDQLSNTN